LKARRKDAKCKITIIKENVCAREMLHQDQLKCHIGIIMRLLEVRKTRDRNAANVRSPRKKNEVQSDNL